MWAQIRVAACPLVNALLIVSLANTKEVLYLVNRPGQSTSHRGSVEWIDRALELVKAEFRRFLNAIMLIPCQVVRTARRILYRVLGYNNGLADFFATWQRLQRWVLIE